MAPGKEHKVGVRMNRYMRQMALPDFGVVEQKMLQQSRVCMIGAGGLGSAALPYLAGVGIGHITIVDNDDVSMNNLHRQTIYKANDAGKNKAKITASYLKELNPDIDVEYKSVRFEKNSKFINGQYNLILDGSDNFETKLLLNDLAIQSEIALLSASVYQYKGQVGLFAGHTKDRSCYRCLFPEVPSDARNCNEAGVLGTAAGLTGLYQAHMAILFLAGFDEAQPGRFLSFDFKNFQVHQFSVPKNPECQCCTKIGKSWRAPKKDIAMIELISKDELQKREHIVIDVRTDPELVEDPVEADLHIELSQIPEKYQELPQDKWLAFVCAGNVRSRQAAEYIGAMGFDKVCVLDKFSL